MKPLERRHRELRRDITSQTQEYRQRIEVAAREAESTLREQHGEVERQLQESLGEARKVEAIEQRKVVLPLTKPRDTGIKEKIVALEAWSDKATSAIEKVKVKLEKAKSEDLAAVEKAAEEAKATLDKAYKEASEYQKEFEAYEKPPEKPSEVTEVTRPGKHMTAAVGDETIYIERLERERQDAVDKLRDFVVRIKLPSGASVGARVAAMGKIAGYDLAGALDAGIDTVTLRLAGFTQASIDAAKEFIDRNIKLDTGKWVNKEEYEVFIAEAPKMPYLKTTPPAWFKQAWEYITDWQEETGETFSDYMQRPGSFIGDIRYNLSPKDSDFRKWYESRESYQSGFVEHPSAESQSKLKERYEEWSALPWYTRILIDRPVILDPETGYYRPIMAGYAPMITPAGGVKLPTRMPKFAPTKTLSITRAEHDRLMAYATKDMAPAKSQWLTNPSKWLTKMKGVVTHMPVPQATQPVSLARIQPVFKPILSKIGYRYNAWTGLYEPTSALQFAQANTLENLGLKLVNGKWVKVTASVIAKSPTSITRVVPLVITIPQLVGLTTVGIIAYKVYTPGVEHPVIVPVEQPIMQNLSTAIQKKITQLSKTMTKKQVLQQLGIEEFESAIQNPWLTPSEALTSVAQFMKETPMPVPIPTPMPIPIQTPTPIPVTEAVTTTTTLTTPTLTPPFLPPTPPPPTTKIPPPPPPLTLKLPLSSVSKVKKVKKTGSICWRQGKVWWIINYPYMDKSDVEILSYPPPGAKVVKGPKSAYQTIQTLTGVPPRELKLDLGIMDINITGGSEMGYSRDIEQKTKGHIELKGVRI